MSEDQPVPVQVALGAFGECPSFEWRGKTYTLGHPTQIVKAVYENAIADAEVSLYQTQLERKWITPAKFDEKLDSLTARIDAPRCEHHTGGPLWMEYTLGEKCATGNVLFLLSLFRLHHPDLTTVDVRAMLTEIPALVRFHMRKVVPSFFEWAPGCLSLTPEQMQEVRTLVAKIMDDMRAKLGTALDEPSPLPTPGSSTPSESIQP